MIVDMVEKVFYSPYNEKLKVVNLELYGNGNYVKIETDKGIFRYPFKDVEIICKK